jgi:hypothetical protein
LLHLLYKHQRTSSDIHLELLVSSSVLDAHCSFHLLLRLTLGLQGGSLHDALARCWVCPNAGHSFNQYSVSKHHKVVSRQDVLAGTSSTPAAAATVAAHPMSKEADGEQDIRETGLMEYSIPDYF